MDEQLKNYVENDALLDARRKIDEILLLLLPEKASNYYIVQHAIAYIEKNYANYLNLAEVADFVGVSPNYLCKLFQEHTGMRFTAYLNFIRIKHAEILLLNSEMRIAAISETVGYSDTSYFIRLFRKYTNCTPSQFRNHYYQYRNEI